MNSADPTHRIQPEVRAAISAFLNEVQRDPKPFALSEALAAIRQIFPEMEISDADLADAIASEALSAGVGIEFDVLKTRKALERRAIERWENEGGASGGRRTQIGLKATRRSELKPMTPVARGDGQTNLRSGIG